MTRILCLCFATSRRKYQQSFSIAVSWRVHQLSTPLFSQHVDVREPVSPCYYSFDYVRCHLRPASTDCDQLSFHLQSSWCVCSRAAVVSLGFSWQICILVIWSNNRFEHLFHSFQDVNHVETTSISILQVKYSAASNFVILSSSNSNFIDLLQTLYVAHRP